jgi:hypothetical protein
MELFAHVRLYAYVAGAEPDWIPVLGVLPERMMSMPTGRVRHRPLEDFERLYVGVGAENYGWYQLMLTAAAKKIYEAVRSCVLARRSCYLNLGSYPVGAPAAPLLGCAYRLETPGSQRNLRITNVCQHTLVCEPHSSDRVLHRVLKRSAGRQPCTRDL